MIRPLDSRKKMRTAQPPSGPRPRAHPHFNRVARTAREEERQADRDRLEFVLLYQDQPERELVPGAEECKDRDGGVNGRGNAGGLEVPKWANDAVIKQALEANLELAGRIPAGQIARRIAIEKDSIVAELVPPGT
jgi:hypothetical protein